MHLGSKLVWPDYDINVSYDSYPIKNTGKLTGPYSSKGVLSSDIKSIPGTTSKGLYIDRGRNMYTSFNVSLGSSRNLKSHPWILSTEVYIPMITYETTSISYSIVEITASLNSVGISVKQEGAGLCMGFVYSPFNGAVTLDKCVCPIIVDRLVHIDLIHTPTGDREIPDNFLYIIDGKEQYEFNVNMEHISANGKVFFTAPEYDYYYDRVYMYIKNMRFRFL